MKESLRRGASKVVAVDPAQPAPARSWSQRDFPIPAHPRKPKAEARTSIHFRIISRTGK